ncbi:hypothetical protein IQ07DRAFT_422647 [Pyrenochaeta sp. DS3sAY3a]|nr:hypothetical protein IQ07DRAFT_422647 [Pyrenochaeta sp. DS3sAY3a]
MQADIWTVSITQVLQHAQYSSNRLSSSLIIAPIFTCHFQALLAQIGIAQRRMRCMIYLVPNWRWTRSLDRSNSTLNVMENASPTRGILRAAVSWLLRVSAVAYLRICPTWSRCAQHPGRLKVPTPIRAICPLSIESYAGGPSPARRPRPGLFPVSCMGVRLQCSLRDKSQEGFTLRSH